MTNIDNFFVTFDKKWQLCTKNYQFWQSKHCFLLVLLVLKLASKWDLTQKSIFCIFFFKNALDCIIFWLKLTTFCNFWQKMTVCVQKITNFGKKWPFFLTKHTQNLCKNKPTSSKIYQYLTVAFLLPQLVSVCSQGKKDKFLTKKIDHFCYFFFKNWLNLPKNTSFWIIFFSKTDHFLYFLTKMTILCNLFL